MKSPESGIFQFSPSIRSGSFSDIGPRRYMEDEHIRIDDLAAHFGSLLQFPKPSAFYAVRVFLSNSLMLLMYLISLY